jgi:hypothetical protein
MVSAISTRAESPNSLSLVGESKAIDCFVLGRAAPDFFRTAKCSSHDAPRHFLKI